MSVVVQKYGGSSVADVASLGRVADRIAETRRQGHEVVVVVSAMGDTTDRLLDLARQVMTDPPRRELDMLLTAGERISMALLSMALHARGVDAISFTGSQSGIITNDAHAGARVVEVRPVRIQDELARGRVVIVAGYQGVSYKKEVTTLGRGGSDTTAVALAAALGAEYCELCSDVDGVYSADPRVVDDARRLAEISHEEMIALAEAGARVLHRAAVDYARIQGITIWARAAGTPPGTQGDGTLIRVAPPEPPRRITGVAHRPILLVRGGPSVSAQDLLRSLEAEGAAVPWLVEAVPMESVTALVALDDVPDPEGLARRLSGSEAVAEVRTEMAAVSVVGTALDVETERIRRALEVVKEVAGTPTAVFRDSLRLTVVVPEDRAEQAVERLHTSLVGASR